MAQRCAMEKKHSNPEDQRLDFLSWIAGRLLRQSSKLGGVGKQGLVLQGRLVRQCSTSNSWPEQCNKSVSSSLEQSAGLPHLAANCSPISSRTTLTEKLHIQQLCRHTQCSAWSLILLFLHFFIKLKNEEFVKSEYGGLKIWAHGHWTAVRWGMPEWDRLEPALPPSTRVHRAGHQVSANWCWPKKSQHLPLCPTPPIHHHGQQAQQQPAFTGPSSPGGSVAG